MPARFDPTFASDLTGRGFVGLFLGLSRSKAETATGNAQASCCRAFSPSDRADGPTVSRARPVNGMVSPGRGDRF